MTFSRLAFVVSLVALLWRLLVLPLLQNELVGLCEWLARWLVQRAVQRLPAQEQARWAEEWLADLATFPTTLTRLGWAAGIRLHAAEQARLLPRERVDDPGVAEPRADRSVTVSAGIAVLVLGVAIWMALGAGGEQVASLFSNLIQALAALGAAVACFRAAGRTPNGFGRAWTNSLHRAWRLLGAAALAWVLGQVVWTYMELRLPADATVPVPSLADLGYLSALPLLIAGVLAFPTAPMRATARLRTLLDGLLIAASLLFVGWATVLGDAFASSGASSTLQRAICLAYPLGDIVAGTSALVLLIWARGRRAGAGHLAMIAAAVLFLLVADLGFAYATPLGSYGTGNLADVGWVAGWLVLMVAAVKPTTSALPRPDGDRELSVARIALPYVPLIVAAATALIIQIVTGEFEPFLVYTGTMIGLLVISRQIVDLIESRQLNARLWSADVGFIEQQRTARDA
jgi:hypothetical protein